MIIRLWLWRKLGDEMFSFPKIGNFISWWDYTLAVISSQIGIILAHLWRIIYMRTYEGMYFSQIKQLNGSLSDAMSYTWAWGVMNTMRFIPQREKLQRLMRLQPIADWVSTFKYDHLLSEQRLIYYAWIITRIYDVFSPFVYFGFTSHVIWL